MNCDRDNPESSAMDCEDDEVLDSKGKEHLLANWKGFLQSPFAHVA